MARRRPIRFPAGLPEEVVARFRTSSSRRYRPGQFASYRHATTLYAILLTWRDEQSQLDSEWEVGVDYTEAEGYYHRHGHHSDVSFNARIFRDNGDPLSAEEATEALRQVADTGALPHGFSAQAVRWQRWHGTRPGRWRDGKEADLENFRLILQRVGAQGISVRLGKVKRTVELPETVEQWMRDMEGLP